MERGGPAGPEGGREALEAIAAGIAHEVRNPLNALRINLSILEQELREIVPDRAGHAFQVIARIASELRSLDDFVTEFLRYAGPPRLRLDRLEVRALLEDLVTFIGPECASKGVALSLAADQGPAAIDADGFQLKHALLNLVLNAVQATPAGGAIAIATGGSAQRLQITVTDSGEGMPAAVLTRVFEAFFTTREGGTGLGLPIARRIVEAHAGSLEIDSREGGGSVALISLPVGGPER